MTEELEVVSYYPKRHAIEYWKKLLANLEDRVDMVKSKIKELENE